MFVSVGGGGGVYFLYNELICPNHLLICVWYITYQCTCTYYTIERPFYGCKTYGELSLMITRTSPMIKETYYCSVFTGQNKQIIATLPL